MNDDEAEKWQQFLNHMKQAEEELNQPQPDFFFQRSIGCFIGGLLGPIVLIALLFVDERLHPDAEAGGLLVFMLLFIIAVPVGGAFTALISPFVVRQVKKLWKRIAK